MPTLEERIANKEVIIIDGVDRHRTRAPRCAHGQQRLVWDRE